MKKIPVWLLLLIAGVVWWLFLRKKPPAALVKDVATNTPPPIPAFGTDAIVDAADATAILQLQPPQLSTHDYQAYIGPIS